MDAISSLWDFLVTHKFLFTALIIFGMGIVKIIILYRIRGNAALLSDRQRKWSVRTKNGVFVFTVLFLFILWQQEINEFALSVTAIAIAFVVASKEIILCFTGSIQRASARSFRPGDWIEVGKHCGEVVDHSMMATTIHEINLKGGAYQYTGRTVVLPNSLFFTHPVVNLNFMKKYVYHEFDITIKEFINLFPLVEYMEERMAYHALPFHDVSQRYNSMIKKGAGVNLPSAQPRVLIKKTTLGDQCVNFMIFCPTERAVDIEQLIKRDFMEKFEEVFPKKED
ncbi:mechanosensitive ion channel family protein [Vibrio sp.]|nr:mechanosensitive ion channel family protein [Vibrio sp.]